MTTGRRSSDRRPVSSTRVHVRPLRRIGFLAAEYLPGHRRELALPKEEVPQEVERRVAFGPGKVDVRPAAGTVADLEQEGGQCARDRRAFDGQDAIVLVGD